MGILVADSKTFSSGVSLSNFVISINGSTFGCRKIVNDDSTIYRIQYEIYYYASQAAYENDSCPIQIEGRQIELSDPNVPIYTSIYNSIKAEYTNFSDI